MKQIENKETSIEKGESNCKYSDLVSIVVNQKQQGGFGITDISMRLKIEDKAKQANGTIDLEDAEFSYLKKLVNESKWNVVNADILKFYEDINSIK